MKLKALKKQTAVPKVQFNSSEDVNYETEYVIEVKNRYELLYNLEKVEDKEPSWSDTTKCITEPAYEIFPKKERNFKKKWMTEEILKLMDERRNFKHDKSVYSEKTKIIKEKCKIAKEIWLNEQCEILKKRRIAQLKIVLFNLEGNLW